MCTHPDRHLEDHMKRIALLIASLLAATGCSSPTGPSRDDDAGKAARAKAQLEAASQNPSFRLATN